MKWAHCRACGEELSTYEADRFDGLCSQQSNTVSCFTEVHQWAVSKGLVPRNGAYAEEKWALASPWQVAIDMWLEAGKPKAPNAQSPGTAP